MSSYSVFFIDSCNESCYFPSFPPLARPPVAATTERPGLGELSFSASPHGG